MAAVTPQTILCEFASVSPARTFVNPRLRQAASPLWASGGQRKGTLIEFD